ncbi:hypothetical protein TRFO_20939 [Tritrichomonas foetus]|uniref:Leucine Rich Repeat family protein n=1 Tax=Tritrichomonas foetus TaxID=1144522 RepID=A0A1J4KF11_9EUKA|nr:hypothetical protein TRFO_20939 [Tritrichomonas foetus]|eukprot:OHT10023.1 hypothetical protein TRFO_20939 [Tritrichomonas foetus]
MNELTHDILTKIDPIFALPQHTTIKIEIVEVHRFKKGYADYYFVISNAGIFLLNIKSFGHPIKMYRSISYVDLISMNVVPKNVIFFSNKTSINIKHDDAVQMGFLVMYIRQALFPPSLLPFSINVNHEVHIIATPDALIYKPQNLFSDRIVSSIMHYDLNLKKITKNNHSILDCVAYLVKGIYTLNNENITDPLISALVLALSFENNFTTLIIEKLKLKIIIQLCSTIFNINKFIQNLIFKEVDFEGAPEEISNVLTSPLIFHPNSLHFSKCTFTDLEIFRSFSLFGKDYKSISFDNCTFDFKDEGINIFHAFNENSCYQTIKSLEFLNIQNSEFLYEMFKNDWIQKTLENISIRNCGIECSTILQEIFNNHTNVKTINLENNKFAHPISFSVANPIEIFSLNLNNCFTNSESLRSLIELISFGNVSVYQFYLSSLDMTEIEFSDFIFCLQDFELSCLKHFSFNFNPMNSELLALFSNFISKQRNLKYLSINNSIIMKDCVSGTSQLLNVIELSNIVHLFLRGDGTANSHFGELINSFIKNMRFNCKLQSLDISRHVLGEKGVGYLKNLFKTASLQNLWFDDISIPNFSLLFQFCTELLDSKVKYSAWPTIECEKLLGLLTDCDEVQSTVEEIARLGELFLQKYGNSEMSEDLDLSNELNTLNQSKKEMNLDYFDTNLINKRSEDVNDLFRECVNVEDGSYIDPMTYIISNFESMISFSELGKAFIDKNIDAS